MRRGTLFLERRKKRTIITDAAAMSSRQTYDYYYLLFSILCVFIMGIVTDVII
jgi:hypothetical protein